MRRCMFCLLTAAFMLIACSGGAPDTSSKSAAITTDSSRLAVPGGEVWYRVTGTGSGVPVILLHGGPGFSSYYLKSMEALGDDRLVVRYDQLGSGKSAHVEDTTLFNIAHFVNELDSLRAHLGLERVHIYGHSWGTILGLEYYRAHPEHVASLTLASPALDIPAWAKHAQELLKTLPDSMQKAVKTREAQNNFEAPDYQATLNEFYGRYVWRKPVQADLDSSFTSFNQSIYNYMQGPSEFTITGTLKTYDSTPFLKDVKVPMLFTVGEFDEANPAFVQYLTTLTRGARAVVIPGAAHIVQWDNPQANVDAVRSFLRDVDARH